MSLRRRFIHSGFSSWLNSDPGRVFRLAAGSGFLTAGLIFRDHLLGKAALVWSFFPLTAGGFDICYISLVLGGPISGKTIRYIQWLQRVNDS